MRGKKIDTEFLTNFISYCVNNGKITKNEIYIEATDQINVIDEELRKLNDLKITRCKLLDVIEAFENK